MDGKNITAPERPCENCHAEIDDFTWLVHRAAHATPAFSGWGLNHLPFSLMPDIGKIIERFGMDLMDWVQRETEKHEHGCITGDCPHESQMECWQRLVADCAADLRESVERIRDQEHCIHPKVQTGICAICGKVLIP